MKLHKIVLIICIISLLFSFTGCKDKEVDEPDISDPETVVEPVETTEPPEEPVDLPEDDVVEPDDQEPETPTEDAYVPPENLEIVEAVDISHMEDDAQLSEAQLTEVAMLVNYAYYNYLWFVPSDGSLTNENMQRFAISYIYQYEYNELFFDTSKFVLHIPEQMVTEIIRLFFDHSFTEHAIEHDLVVYEDGFYQMTAIDGGILAEPSVISISKTSDFSYTVTYDESEEDIAVDAADMMYQIDIEERDGRFIYTAYRTIMVEPETAE